MGRARIHKNDAAKQKAYRERLKARAITPAVQRTGPSPGVTSLVERVMASDAAAQK